MTELRVRVFSGMGNRMEKLVHEIKSWDLDVHCHIAGHMEIGIMAMYQVQP